MDRLNLDLEARVYLQSETAFNQARTRGFLEMMLGLIRGCHQLLPLYELVDPLPLQPAIDRGLQDIPLKNIIGSTGRYRDFTRHFLPRSGDNRSKERWRNIYTLAITGKGFPPIEVYQIEQVYFVIDGHHRVSVAGDLDWPTIQAYVTELPGVTVSFQKNC